MTQNFPNIASTDLISASRQKILDRDNSNKSNFAGTTFPSVDLVIGQSCYRTDLKKFYVLESDGPTVWRELQLAVNLGTAAAATIGTAGDTVPKNNTTNTFSALQTFAAGIALAAQTIQGNSGFLQMDADVRLNAASTKIINFLINNVSRMQLATDGGLVVGAATGGSKGAGSINAASIYLNGTALGSAATKNTGTGAGQIPSVDDLGDLAFKDKIDETDIAPGSALAQLPIGSLYFNATDNTNPASLLGYGVWSAFGQGRVMLGVGTGEDINAYSQTFAPGETGGEFRHTQTVPEIAQHNTGYNPYNRKGSNIEYTEQSFGYILKSSLITVGNSQPMPWLQPYVAVYIWRRTG